MNITKRIKQLFAPEKRASNKNDERYWTTLFGSRRTSTGITITPDKAMQASTVYACNKVLAETIASLPLKIFKRLPKEGKEPAPDFYLYDILRTRPNEIQTSFEFREYIVTQMNMYGNFFGLKEISNRGEIVNIIPLDAARMVVIIIENRQIFYEYTWESGKTSFYSANDIWHIPSLSIIGFVGLSPIQAAKESIGLSLATEEHGARVFSNDARPGGVLSHPGTLSEPAQKNLLKSFNDAQAGLDNSHKTVILEEGLSWTAVGFNNDESQFLETRNFQVEDGARIFRVPGVLIGHPSKASTFASAEQFFLSFAKNTILPWVVKLEQSANKHLLLTETERKTYFVEFNMAGLLRGDTKSRFEAYAIARQNKWMNANEVRALENMNPIEGGEVYENPNIQVNDSDSDNDQKPPDEGSQDADTEDE